MQSSSAGQGQPAEQLKLGPEERPRPELGVKVRRWPGEGQLWPVYSSGESPAGGGHVFINGCLHRRHQRCPSTPRSESLHLSARVQQHGCPEINHFQLPANLSQWVLSPRVICLVSLDPGWKVKVISPYKGLTPINPLTGEKF